MESKNMALNVTMIFVSVAIVLGFRMETAQTSYDISKKYSQYKKFESSTKILSARYEKKIGSERMVTEAGGMVAMSAPKTEQVVMISPKGTAIKR